MIIQPLVNLNNGAQVTQRNALDMQVCVPRAWTDDQIISFAEQAYPCGTISGWFIRKEGNPRLGGVSERVQCAKREGYVHIMLDA